MVLWLAGLSVGHVEGEGEFVVGRCRLDAHGPWSVIQAEKPREPAALGLEGIHGKCVVIAPARMHHMVLTATFRSLHPGVHYIECQGRVDSDLRMQRRPRLPRAVAHARHEFS